MIIIFALKLFQSVVQIRESHVFISTHIDIDIQTCVLQSTSRSLHACTLESNFTRLNLTLWRNCSWWHTQKKYEMVTKEAFRKKIHSRGWRLHRWQKNSGNFPAICKQIFPPFARNADILQDLKTRQLVGGRFHIPDGDSKKLGKSSVIFGSFSA